MSQIQNYQRPQALINQVLETPTPGSLDRFHAVVVGPAFVGTDEDNLAWTPYVGGAMELTYDRLVDGASSTTSYDVELDTVEVEGENLAATLWSRTAEASAGTGYFTVASDNVAGDVLEYTHTDGDLSDLDAGRLPQAGDTLVITSLRDEVSGGPSRTVTRTVHSLIGRQVAASAALVGYTGATAWQDGVLDDIVEVAATSSAWTGLTLSVSQDMSPLWMLNNGTPAPASVGGLMVTRTFRVSTAGVSPELEVVGYPTDTVVLSALSGGGWELSYTPAGSLVPFTANLEDADGTGELASTFTLVFYAKAAQDGSATEWPSGLDTVFIDASWLSIDVTAYTLALAESGSRLVAGALVARVTAVTATTATLSVTSSAGLMAEATLALTNTPGEQAVDYDGDDTVALTTGSAAKYYHVGQTFTFYVTPPTASTTVFDKIRLNAATGFMSYEVSDDRKVAVTGLYKGIAAIPSTGFTAAADKITLVTPLLVPVPGYGTETTRALAANYGRVAPVWRAQVPAAANERPIRIDTVTDIFNAYGSYGLTPNTELAFGCVRALDGSSGKTVFALNTGGTTYEHFVTAFSRLSKFRNGYAFAVLTEDEDVMQLAANHMRENSSETAKRFRRAYVGTDSPETYPILEDISVSIEQTTAGVYTTVHLTAPDDVELDSDAYAIDTDDVLILGYADSATRYKVLRVTGPTTLLLQSGPATPVSGLAQLYAGDTPEKVARFVWKRSERLGDNADEDRRIANVWIDNGQYSDDTGTVTIPNRFLACEMAGRRAYLPPQQGLTRQEVATVNEAPTMYSRFTDAILDDMASHGVWVVTQDSSELPCYVRHQLTTGVGGGSLHYEDSVGANVDDICFAFDDIIEPMIGKKNVNSKTLAEVKAKSVDMLARKTRADIDSDIGPQLETFYDKNGNVGTVTVEIDHTFRDRINITAVGEIPLPFNNAKIVFVGRTIQAAGATTTGLSATVTL